jgi:hypothetical protein
LLSYAKIRIKFHKKQQCFLINEIKNIYKILPMMAVSGRNMEAKAVPLTGREGPYGRETLRLQHFLYIQLQDGGDIVSLTRLLPFTVRKIPGTHFCWKRSAVGWIRYIKIQ